MKHRNIGLALLLVAALSSQTMLGLTAREITVNRDAIKALLNTPISANQADNEANADKLRMHRDTLKKAKKLTNEAEINNKINDFRYGKTRAELYQESLDIQATSAAGVSACSAELGNCKGDLASCEQDRDQMQAGISTREQMIDGANEQIRKHEATIAGKEESLKVLQAQLAQTQKDLAAARSGAGTASNALTKAQADLAAAQKDVLARQDELTKCQAELAKKTAESEKNLGYWQDAEKRVEAAKQENMNKQAEINEAETKLAAETERADKAEADVTRLQEAKYELSTIRLQLSRQLESVKALATKLENLNNIEADDKNLTVIKWREHIPQFVNDLQAAIK